LVNRHRAIRIFAASAYANDAAIKLAAIAALDLVNDASDRDARVHQGRDPRIVARNISNSYAPRGTNENRIFVTGIIRLALQLDRLTLGAHGKFVLPA